MPGSTARRFRPALERLEERTALTTFTTTSPTSAGALPAGVSPVGGLVLDLVGVNGRRVVGQLPARSLFSGFFDRGTPDGFRGDPGTIGVQTGFSAEVLASLGGGLAEVAVRLTISDGDTAPGDFDFDDNVLLLNGTPLGSFSDVLTEETGPDGQAVLSASPAGGFRNDRLDTGFFHSVDPAFLQEFFATLSRDGAVVFQLADDDPFDNFLDFTIGIEGELLDAGAPPAVVTPPPLLPPPAETGEPVPPAPAAEVVLPVLDSPGPALAIALMQTGTTEALAPSPVLDAAPFSPAAVPVLGGSDAVLPPAAPESPVALVVAGSEEEAEPSPERTAPPDPARAVSQATGAALQVVAGVAEGTVQAASHFTRLAAEALDQVFIELQAEAARIRLATAEVPPPTVPVGSVPPMVQPDLSAAPAAKADGPPQSRAVIRTTVLMLSALLIHRSWSSSRASAAFLARRRRRRASGKPQPPVGEMEQGAG